MESIIHALSAHLTALGGVSAVVVSIGAGVKAAGIVAAKKIEAAVRMLKSNLNTPQDIAAMAAVKAAILSHIPPSENLAQDAAAVIVSKEPVLKPFEAQLIGLLQTIINGAEQKIENSAPAK